MKLHTLIKSVIVLKFVFSGLAAAASGGNPYYGDKFYNELNSGASDLTLVSTLVEVLSKMHIAVPGQNDLIQQTCDRSAGKCYGHTAIGYKEARKFLVNGFYVVSMGNRWGVKDVYCGINREAGKKSPTDLPNNKVINIEHTWPQSRFNRSFSKELQKSDLHHLYPTDPIVNMVRGNHIFGEVETDDKIFDCPGPRFGLGSAGAEDVFEPPQEHKGNVARALFYFAIRYDLKIKTDEEKVLRQWHLEDPVDDEEIRRNEEIFKVQLNRNPFIDFPELTERISDF